MKNSDGLNPPVERWAYLKDLENVGLTPVDKLILIDWEQRMYEVTKVMFPTFYEECRDCECWTDRAANAIIQAKQFARYYVELETAPIEDFDKE